MDGKQHERLGPCAPSMKEDAGGDAGACNVDSGSTTCSSDGPAHFGAPPQVRACLPKGSPSEFEALASSMTALQTHEAYAHAAQPEAERRMLLVVLHLSHESCVGHMRHGTWHMDMRAMLMLRAVFGV